MHCPKSVSKIWRAKKIGNVTEEERKTWHIRGPDAKSEYKRAQCCFREICQVNVVLNCLEDHYFQGAECQ